MVQHLKRYNKHCERGNNIMKDDINIVRKGTDNVRGIPTKEKVIVTFVVLRVLPSRTGLWNLLILG